MNKFTINLVGRIFKSDSLSAKGVETFAQKGLDQKFGEGMMLIRVDDFTDDHFKATIERHLRDASEINAIHQVGEFLEIDRNLLWPELQRVLWTNVYTMVYDSKNTMDELNYWRRTMKCSKLKDLSIISSPTEVIVEMWKG